MVDLALVWSRVEQDLTALARLSGGEVESALTRLVAALEPALRLRLVEALAEAGEELNQLMPALRVKTLITPAAVTFSVETEQGAAEVSGELDARVTLRLPEELKIRIEASADLEGLSLNAWLVKTLARSASQTLTGPLSPSRPDAPSRPDLPTGVGRQLRGRGHA